MLQHVEREKSWVRVRKYVSGGGEKSKKGGEAKRYVAGFTNVRRTKGQKIFRII